MSRTPLLRRAATQATQAQSHQPEDSQKSTLPSGSEEGLTDAGTVKIHLKKSENEAWCRKRSAKPPAAWGALWGWSCERRGVLSVPRPDLHHRTTLRHADAHRSALPTEGLRTVHTGVTAEEPTFYRLWGTRCHVGTCFGEEKQVRANSLSVCVRIHLRTRERQRAKELAQSDLTRCSVG